VTRRKEDIKMCSFIEWGCQELREQEVGRYCLKVRKFQFHKMKGVKKVCGCHGCPIK
jgi:hypothetical protein